MYIMSVNGGSSSLKLSVYAVNPDLTAIVEVNISSIYSNPTFSSSRTDEKTSVGNDVHDLDSALQYCLKKIPEDKVQDISHVCHRVVHGGDYDESILMTNDSLEHLKTLSDLAPLHNAASLNLIRACLKSLPHSKSIAFFDSAFHYKTIPPHIYSYAINQSKARELGIRKYGFHGLSYSFIIRSVSDFLGKDADDLNLIALHLGAGASVCAIKGGKSLDTSMGLTPLDGLPGATRSGSVDPSMIFHYTNNAGVKLSHQETSDMHITEAERILNKESGWESLTGTTNFGEIASSTSPTHQLAFNLFKDRVLNFVGSYYVKLGGKVDALVFAGGIGERSARLREEVVNAIECLGFKIDKEGNASVGKSDDDVIEIGHGESKSKVLVCKTDEQLEMAGQCVALKEFW